MGRGGFGNFGQMRTLAELIAPGGGIQSLFRRFGLVEPRWRNSARTA